LLQDTKQNGHTPNKSHDFAVFLHCCTYFDNIFQFRDTKAMGSQKTGRKNQMMEASGDLERIFRQREQNSDDETAALFLISISRTKDSRVRVEVDASVDEDVVRRLVDDEKVQRMRLRRREQQERLQAVPFDDGYRIKQRRVLSAVEGDRKKTLTKLRQQGNKKDKEKVKVTEVTAKDRLLRKAQSEKASKANQRLRDQEARSQLPDFAKPFIKVLSKIIRRVPSILIQFRSLRIHF
jgi:hypothetical protein